MENELKVWISTILCLSDCHYIVSRLISKGFLKLISLLPVFYFFITAPLSLHSFHLCGPTIVLLVWLGLSRLLLFSFNLGPLSSPQPPTLFHFITLACLPIKMRQYPYVKTPSIDDKSATKGLPNKSVVLAVKALLLGLVIHAYNYRPVLHPYILALYCCHMYLGLEVLFPLVETPAHSCFEPSRSPMSFTSPLPYKIFGDVDVRPTVYDPTRCMCARVGGERWGRLSVFMATFAASGLMHDGIYYYLTRVQPTWEVTWFFVLHGASVVVEVELKKAVSGRWRLPPVAPRLLTFVFLAVTGNWLFFPSCLGMVLIRRPIEENAIVAELVQAKMSHLHF